MKLKCNKIRSAVTLREEDGEEDDEEDDEEECDLTMTSDTEGTSISVTSQVENIGPRPCMLKLGIEPKLASLVTLYSETEGDTEDVIVFPSQHQDECTPARPEVPEDFVPRCGRYSGSRGQVS